MTNMNNDLANGSICAACVIRTMHAGQLTMKDLFSFLLIYFNFIFPVTFYSQNKINIMSSFFATQICIRSILILDSTKLIMSIYSELNNSDMLTYMHCDSLYNGFCRLCYHLLAASLSLTFAKTR
jgi:hypothetical protein